MALSKRKNDRLEIRRRQKLLNNRSLDGRGYWMDAGHEATAREFLLTGKDETLNLLPDYSHNRRPKNA